MLIKKTERQARRGMLAGALPTGIDGGLDRRTFLRRSGLATGSLASLGALTLGSVRKAEAGPPPPKSVTLLLLTAERQKGEAKIWSSALRSSDAFAGQLVHVLALPGKSHVAHGPSHRLQRPLS